MVKDRLIELQRVKTHDFLLVAECLIDSSIFVRQICEIVPSSNGIEPNQLTLNIERRPIDDEIAGVLQEVQLAMWICFDNCKMHMNVNH